MERPTITDVAKLAGVSMSTVSRALRGSDKISLGTRQRVEKAASQLGFTLSKSASALASGKTMRVMLLVSGTLNSWFNSSTLQGVYEVLSSEGYDTIPSFILNKEQLDRTLAELPRNRNVDALIVSSFVFGDMLHRQMETTGIPVIGLDSPSREGFDASVGIDNHAALEQSVRTLYSLGHRRLAFVRDYIPEDLIYSTGTRGDAFTEAVAKLGEDLSYDIITADRHPDGLAPEHFAAPLASRLLSSAVRPTGVIAETDELAVALIKELRRQHVRLPEDMSIIGFDDSPWSRIIDLTTNHQDPEQLGRIAAGKTLALMKGEPLEHPHETLPATLILRETTGRAPNDVR